MDRKSTTILGIVAALLLVGGASVYAAFSLSGTSSATATAGAPTIAAAPTIGIVTSGQGTAGTCNLGSGSMSFACTGTSVTEGDGYTVTFSVSNPAASSQALVVTYSDSGSGWSSVCSVNGVGVANGGSTTIISGSNSITCTITSSSVGSTDTFSLSLT